MGTLPNVNIEQTNGNLGRTNAIEDGTSLLVASGVAIVGEVVLNTHVGPFTSLAEVEEIGVNAAYDAANLCLVWHHVRDFFAGAAEMGVVGPKLYLLVLADTVTLTQALDPTLENVEKALRAIGGDVKLLGAGRIPAVADTLVAQFETDLSTAIPKAQTLVAAEFAEPNYRPLQIILEGRNWQGTPGTTKDNHTFAANRVSVVMSQDAEVAAENAAYAKHAHYGYTLGILAGLAVQRNIGRVKSGALTHIQAPALSNGTQTSAILPATLEALNAKGYIFIRKHAGKDGYFFNDDHTCAPLSDDYCKIAHGRVMDKASRITRVLYVEEINDDIDLDPATGKLPISVVKDFQGTVEEEINTQMTAKKEISAVAAYVNPAQNVGSTDLIEIEINIRKRGTARYIKAKLAFATFSA